MNPKRNLILCSVISALIALFVFSINGCSTAAISKVPTVIPPPPNSASVIGDHKNRETVQGKATDSIDKTVTGTTVEAPVKEQTAVIRDANKAASADEIAKMAADFSLTLSAQATELKRLQSENKRLTESNTSLTAQLDDFGRKIAVYTCNGIGGLLLLAAVVVGIATKDLGYVAWCLGGSFFGFGAARVIGHWLFPYIVGGGVLIIVAAAVFVFLKERSKAKHLSVADDMVGGIEDIRALFKTPPAEIVEAIRNADSTEKAIAAAKAIGAMVGRTLDGWIKEVPGNAALVDERRRALGLIS